MTRNPLLTVIESLSFAEHRCEILRELDSVDWQALLPLTDRSQLTLPLGIRAMDYLPYWVQERIRRDLENNAIRHVRTVELHELLEEALSQRAIEFLILKGIPQYLFYCPDPSH